MAKNGVVRLTHRRKRQRVCGSAIKNEKYLCRTFEKLANKFAGSCRPRVITVAGDGVCVGLRDRSPRVRADAGSVVAGKLVAGHDSAHWRRRQEHETEILVD